MTNHQTNDPSGLMSEAGSAIGSVASDIRSAASHRLEEAVTDVRAKADDTKSDVAEQVMDMADALRRAAEDLPDGSMQERTLDRIANSLDSASDSLRDKDLGEMMQMMNRVARDNPVMFLGGAALLGFAVSRFFMASEDHHTHSGARNHGNGAHGARPDTMTGVAIPSSQPPNFQPQRAGT